MSMPSTSSFVYNSDLLELTIESNIKPNWQLLSEQNFPFIRIVPVTHAEHEEDVLAEQFKKLHNKVKDILHILPANNEFWYSDLRDETYVNGSFFIPKNFANSFLNKSPLLENSLFYHFNKLYPHLGDRDLLTVVSYGCWNEKRVHYWLNQVKNWREREVLRISMRAKLVRKSEENPRLHSSVLKKIERATKEKLKEKMDHKIRKILGCFFQKSSPSLNFEEDPEEQFYQSLGYGNTDLMLEVVTEWYEGLKTEFCKMQKNIHYMILQPADKDKDLVNKLWTETQDVVMEDLPSNGDVTNLPESIKWLERKSKKLLGTLEEKRYEEVEMELLRVRKQRTDRKIMYLNEKIEDNKKINERLNNVEAQVYQQSHALQIELIEAKRLEEQNKTIFNINQATRYQYARDTEERYRYADELLEKEIEELERRISELSSDDVDQ